jgi:hypothetical protein
MHMHPDAKLLRKPVSEPPWMITPVNTSSTFVHHDHDSTDLLNICAMLTPIMSCAASSSLMSSTDAASNRRASRTSRPPDVTLTFLFRLAKLNIRLECVDDCIPTHDDRCVDATVEVAGTTDDGELQAQQHRTRWGTIRWRSAPFQILRYQTSCPYQRLPTPFEQGLQLHGTLCLLCAHQTQ